MAHLLGNPQYELFFCFRYSLGLIPMFLEKARLKVRTEEKPEEKATSDMLVFFSSRLQAYSMRRLLMKSGKLIFIRSLKMCEM